MDEIKKKLKLSWEKIKKTSKALSYVKQLKLINTLETENIMLRDSIKEELYKEYMKKLGEPIENERLRKENKRLRQQVKSLKEIIKEGR